MSTSVVTISLQSDGKFSYLRRKTKQGGPNDTSRHLGPCELCNPPSELAVVHVIVDLGSRCVAALCRCSAVSCFYGEWESANDMAGLVMKVLTSSLPAPLSSLLACIAVSHPISMQRRVRGRVGFLAVVDAEPKNEQLVS